MFLALPGTTSTPTSFACHGSSSSVKFYTNINTNTNDFYTNSHKYKYTNTQIQIQQHKYKYKRFFLLLKHQHFTVCFRNECRQTVCSSASHGLCECGKKGSIIQMVPPSFLNKPLQWNFFSGAVELLQRAKDGPPLLSGKHLNNLAKANAM